MRESGAGMPLLRTSFFAVLAGAVFLRPTGLAPVRDARTQMPPDVIVRAVATGDPGFLEFALAEGANVDGRDADGRTALAVAVAQQNSAMTQRLLALNANVD